MQLNELFDKDFGDIKVRSRGTIWRANFEDIELVAGINDENTEGDDIWEVIFSVDNSTGKTGRGDEVKVFSVVTKMMSMFINDRDPHAIYMTAKEDNRAKLYMRMLNRTPKFKRKVVLPGLAETLIIASKTDKLPIQMDDETGRILCGVGQVIVGITEDGWPEIRKADLGNFSTDDIESHLEREIDYIEKQLQAKQNAAQ